MDEWSRDLFSTGCLGEVTDEEIATEHREDASLFAELTFEQWKVVYQTKIRGVFVESGRGASS